MAVSKAKEWLTQDKLTLLTAWARDGLKEDQIANNIGISRSTLFEWRKKHQDISNALKKGKEVIDIEVENALLKRALGYEYIETTEEPRQNPLTNEIELYVTKRVTKQVIPDTTAQIYWLKNRKPKDWRERQDGNAENSNKDGIIKDLIGALNNVKNDK